MPTDDLKKLKHVEYYSATVTAWYNTQLEHDKNLLTLSAGGIGLLISLLSTVGVPSAEGLVLYVVALCCFVTCLGSVLAIFKQNGKYVEIVLSGEAPPNNPVLPRLDSLAIYSFAAGVIFSVVIGVSAAITSYSKLEKEKIMATENKSSSGKTIAQESFDRAANLRPAPETGVSISSFNGAGNLSPQQEMVKSFTGAENLKPSVPTPSNAGGTTKNSTAPSSSSQQSGNKK